MFDTLTIYFLDSILMALQTLLGVALICLGLLGIAAVVTAIVIVAAWSHHFYRRWRERQRTRDLPFP